MSYPKTTVDEYGRIRCKAHDLETCRICRMSFESINEENDATPSDRDVGVFLPDSSLLDWFDKMKKKMPMAFSADDTLFGDDSGQHIYGTKLKTFFDDDPEQPMECYVLGSKWQLEECRYPGMSTMFPDGREPVYVVLMNGEPTQINFMDAHEGEYGWMVDTSKRMKKENGIIINERLDMLARLNGSHHLDSKDVDFEEDFKDTSDYDSGLLLKEKNAQIKRALKTLQTIETANKWASSDYNEFIEEFLKYSFTSEERDVINQFPTGCLDADESDITIEHRIKSFPPSIDNVNHMNNNFYARIALAKMAIYHVVENLGGVILANKRRTKYQAIEFIDFRRYEGVPCIQIQYGVDPEGIQRPKEFMAGETIEVMNEENQVAVILEQHFLNCIKNTGLNDIGSGLIFYQGHFAPLPIVPFCDDAKSSISIDPAPIPEQSCFGVELELSCASGNQTKKVAAILARNADLKVRVRDAATYSKGGFWSQHIDKSKSYDSDDDSDGDASCSSHESMPNLDPTLQLTTVIEGPSIACNKDDKNDVLIGKHTKWSICYDKSIQPNANNPLSTVMELISPILTGEAGLKEMERTLTVTSDVVCIRLNDSMGLHVHVQAKESEYSLESMISICQHFVIYEEVIDRFFEQSRRSGSKQSHSYFQSNRLSIMASRKTVTGAVDRLLACTSRKELYDVMNPGMRARYHKLNLQNLRTGRQPTIEFRQHHASRDSTEIKTWVRFRILFVHNAAKLKPITGPFDATFDTLFETIIQCPVMRSYYLTKAQ